MATDITKGSSPIPCRNRAASLPPDDLPGIGHNHGKASCPVTRNNSFFRNIQRIHTSGDVYGSLPHSSLAGLPIAPSPLIEKKLNRIRNLPGSPTRLATIHIPTQLSDITCDWVLLVLNQHRAVCCQEPVAKSELQKISIFDCKTNVGDFSSTYQIDVVVQQGKKDAKTYNFIAKLLPADDPGRLCVFEANLFEKEIEIYFDLLPSIKQLFLQNRLLTKSQVELEEIARAASREETFVDRLIPQCVFSSSNTDGAGVLVFKSCTSEAYESCCNPDGLSLEELREVVKAMAQFHAASFCFLQRCKPEHVERRYPCLKKDMYANSRFVQELSGHMATYDEFLKMVAADMASSSSSVSSSPNECIITGESIAEARRQFSRMLKVDTWDLVKGFRRQGPKLMTTICHGEFWEGNILIRKQGNGSECQVKLLDWKNTKISTSTLDLAFLMFCSTNYKLRSESTSEILQLYHDTYCDTLAELSPELRAPSIDELEEDYHQSSEYALLQAIVMFVQQMHQFNTLIEDLSKPMETGMDSRDRLEINFLSTNGTSSKNKKR